MTLALMTEMGNKTLTEQPSFSYELQTFSYICEYDDSPKVMVVPYCAGHDGIEIVHIVYGYGGLNFIFGV